MSDCPRATNGAAQVRKLQRALYRTSKQDKKKRFYSLYDKVWRADVLWEAWRQVKANKGAPGVDGMAIEWIINTGYEEEMIQKLHEALREQRYQFAPVRVVEIPKPKGGTRPLGIATVEDRVVQTAMKLVLEPIFEADFHDSSYTGTGQSGTPSKHPWRFGPTCTTVPGVSWRLISRRTSPVSRTGS